MTIKTRDDIIDKLSIFASDLDRKSPATQNYYLCIADKFLTECGDFSRPAMRQFIDNMGYCDNSVRTVYYVLKRLCKALSIPFPLDTEFLPPVPDEDELYTPTTSVGTIHNLINYHKQYPGEYITSLVFLSTMYGLRSIEMTRIEIAKTTFIMTVAKRKGRANKPVIREHLVPEGMMEYLSGYTRISERTVEYTFHKACRAIGYKPQRKENWHSMRRALDTAMVDAHIDNLLIKRFMRWTKNRSDMTNVYYHKDFETVNREMFAVHPFIRYWR